MHGLRYAAAFSLLVARVVSAANVTMHGWYNCSQYSLIEEVPRNADPAKAPPAQCATFKVPLCYEGICKDPSAREIDIFVKRYANGKPEGKANVIFMQGGPGAASPAMESAMTELNRLLGDRVNVYTLDHRGTGRSNKLDCVASQATTSGSPGGMGLDAKEFEGCARELENKYGSDLSSFSVTSAASDLKFFIANFLQGETTYVYGVSYGTLLVERLMHLNPPGVAGYILDGIATTSGASSGKGMYMSKWDLGMDEVARYFLSYCEKNRETCGKYFGSSGVTGALSDLLRSLTYGSHTCSYFLSTQLAKALQLPRSSSSSAGVYLRAIFGSLLQNYSLRNVIPAIVYRVARCDYEDQKVLERFFSTLGKQLQLKSEEDQLMSQLLYGLIVYSELWESPPVTDEIAAERFLNALMGSGVSAGQYCAYAKDSTSQACRTYKYTVGSYDASPITYKKDKYYNVAAKPPANVSVLLLSGKMDPQTPHKYAEYLYEALDTTNKALITFEYATHGALWRTPVVDSSTNTTCGMSILASYIANSGKLEAVDKSCVANEKPLDFVLPASILSEWLNTSSPFEGKLMEGESSSSSSSSPFKAGFAVLTFLFVAALMIAIIFGVLWVRARRARAAAPAKEQGVYEASTV